MKAKDIFQKVSTEKYKIEKLAGIMFIFFITVSIFHYTLIETRLIVSGNTADIINFIRTNELLFRAGIVIDLILFISGIILSFVLYVILNRANKNLALLALILMLIETVTAVVIEFSSFIALLLLNNKGYLPLIETEQVEVLLGLTLSFRAAGYSIVNLFFSMGFIIVFYLFFISNYIPKKLSVLGILLFLLMLILTCIKIVIPNNCVETLEQLSSGLVMLLLITVGLRLLIKG